MTKKSLHCESYSLWFWGFRNESRSCKRKRKGKSRILRCAKSLNRMPVPFFSGSRRPGLLSTLHCHDSCAIGTIWHRNDIHIWRGVERLSQLILCLQSTTPLLCFTFGPDVYLNQSFHSQEVEISSCYPFYHILNFSSVAYDYNSKL